MNLQIAFSFIFLLNCTFQYTQASIASDFLVISTPNGEEKFTSSDGKVNITFPAEYKIDTTKAESAITLKISALVGEITYFFGLTEHSQPITGHEDLASVSLESFVSSLSGEIVSQETYSYKKNDGVSAKIKIGDQGYCLYKVILIGQKQFQLIVISPQDDFSKMADSFFKSFKVKE